MSRALLVGIGFFLWSAEPCFSAPAASSIPLEGAREKCEASFFHFAETYDLALVPVRCLDNLVTGGVTAKGNRSVKVVVHPEVEKKRHFDPSLVEAAYALSVVAFPKGTAETVTPLAPVAPKLSQAELVASSPLSTGSALPSITDEKPLELGDREIHAGSPLHDSLGRTFGVVTSCKEVAGEPAQCDAVAVHNLPTFELLWNARKKFGPRVADYRIPSLDVERAELCGLFRRRCVPQCQRPCYRPPQPANCQNRPAVVNFPAPQAAAAAAASASATASQQASQRTNVSQNNRQSNNQENRQDNNNNQRVDNRQSFNVSPQITNNPVIHFSPVINAPSASATGGSHIEQGSRNSESGDSIAALQAAENRLYQEREELASRRERLTAAIERERSAVDEAERRNLAEFQAQRGRAESLQRQQQADLEKLKQSNEALERQAREAQETAKRLQEEQEEARRAAEEARAEAERLREVARQTTQAALLQQEPVQESTITGKEQTRVLPNRKAVDHALAFDRTPSAPKGELPSGLGSLVAQNSSQLDGKSSAYGEQAFFASLPAGWRDISRLDAGAGVSEAQLQSLVANYRLERASFAEYLVANASRAPWWAALGEEAAASKLPAANLTREQFFTATRSGTDPSFFFPES